MIHGLFGRQRSRRQTPISEIKCKQTVNCYPAEHIEEPTDDCALVYRFVMPNRESCYIE